MENLLKRTFIKIPRVITFYFCNKNNFLLLKGEFGFKVLKLKLKIFLSIKDHSIFVTNQSLDIKLRIKKKKMKILQATTIFLIKKAFLDVSRQSYKKLKLCGVGFKISLIKFTKIKLLHLTLGYSHSIYFKIPKDISILEYTPTKFVIFGNSNEKVTSIAAQIRSYKIPEPYKGKGILYENEIPILKEGKKA